MLAHSVTTALATLATAPDADHARACLDHVSAALIRAPEDAVAIVKVLGASDHDDGQDDPLAEILSAALDVARMAQEKDQARGEVLIATLSAAVAQMATDGDLTMPGRLVLSQAWVRAGLTPPEALAWQDGVPDDQRAGVDVVDPFQLDQMIDEVFGDLVTEAEGDVSMVHGALSEMLPSLPADIREAVIRVAVARPDAIFGRLGCAFLLDPALGTRLAAAEGLTARFSAGRLEAEVAAHLVSLRSWLPDDAARASLDTLLQRAMRRGVSGGEATRPWAVHKILATLPDGTGSQSVAVSLERGNQRALAMLLLKQDFGVKDAYLIACPSATEQRRILDSLETDTDALTATPDYLVAALELALADGLAHGRPPAPGLVEVVDVCGLTGLRPQHQTTAELLRALDPQGRIAALSPQARGRLINASEVWPDAHDMLDSWFEDGDACREVLDVPRAPRRMETALWTWLDSRRDWWARIIARSAQLLLDTGHADAQSFIATAQSLIEGRPLRKIPVMAEVHDLTIGSWLHNGAEDAVGPDLDGSLLEDLDDLPPMPAPEASGELPKLLKGAALSPGWIDGYLVSICVAPKPVTPDRWVQPLLTAALPVLTDRHLQRFLDLMMFRYDAALDQLADPATCEAALAAMSPGSLGDWCAGFLAGKQNFKSSWPAKTLGPADKAILRQITQRTEAPATDVPPSPDLAAWLIRRFDTQPE
ncbi:UPF0149 family protein [Pseudoruegeria sp. SK021]|uniref:UPF0149 family protein n=1 Tax=Pseudoruegeria sp. SK021 TaxID=1933035 RepID=UPI000A228D7A|nr:UPF0149 family protein [Pseudoruegeria sp. SK021]OSP53727.1 hypothetical protein BV911_16430 [Pseudoruegeria sp. SK021]